MEFRLALFLCDLGYLDYSIKGCKDASARSTMIVQCFSRAAASRLPCCGAMDTLIDFLVVLAPAAIGLMCIAVASFAQTRRH
jgi:hypothetical protein